MLTYCLIFKVLYGGPSGTRTPDLPVMSPTSCQLLHSAILKLVPKTGIEPVRKYKFRRILSPVRLPVPPLRHAPIWLRPTLPGGCPPSTISAQELNFCVRNGNRCILFAIITKFIFFFSSTSIILTFLKSFVKCFFTLFSIFFF